MKLIDILVRELPKLGGWPIGADRIYQNAKGHLVGVQGCIISPVDMELAILSEDLHKSVAREQYEAALAASKPEWNGEGLPPVGLECEMSYAGDEWHKCVIIAKGEEQIIYQAQGSREFSGHRNNYRFRPIRSEADKKREIIISKIEKAYKDCPHSDAVPQAIYEAIAEHIRID